MGEISTQFPLRTLVRLLLGSTLVVTVAFTGLVVSGDDTTSDSIPAYDEQARVPAQERQRLVGPRGDVTVVTGHAYNWSSGELIAFAPDGRVLYYNDSLDSYLDVEPSRTGVMTVRYVGAYVRDGDGCRSPLDRCTVSVVERVNLTTGETTRLYSRVIPQDDQANWYDVDRIDEHRLLVADLYGDRVYVYNLTSDLVEWEWDAQSDFAVENGGDFPQEWVNVDDVQWLSDGRVMISLQNLDQVVFVDRENGLDPQWTLGSENATDVLHEPLDADYIPPEHGGPAVLVADSKNDRVVEYQFENGSWNQTWMWRDETLRWPRDVDRLPNGHTLVVDAKGQRVVEIDRDGRVVWNASFFAAMDAERLGTGDGSTNGPSATEAGLESRGGRSEPPGGGDESGSGALSAISRDASSAVSSVIGLLNPPGLPFYAFLGGVGAALTVVFWAAVEWRWSEYRLDVRVPVRLRK